MIKLSKLSGVRGGIETKFLVKDGFPALFKVAARLTISEEWTIIDVQNYTIPMRPMSRTVTEAKAWLVEVAETLSICGLVEGPPFDPNHGGGS